MSSGTDVSHSVAGTEMTATEVSRNFSDVISRVSEGETIVITRGGRSVARLEPVAKTWLTWAELMSILRDAPSPDDEFEADLRRIREEQNSLPERSTPLEWD